MPAKSESAETFLWSLHCMCQVGGDDLAEPRACENWPRVGLEAMAVGVPIVAEHRGGWPEMVTHLKTGMLGHSHGEIARHVIRLAHGEALRLRIASQAREALSASVATPERLWAGWAKVFGEVSET